MEIIIAAVALYLSTAAIIGTVIAVVLLPVVVAIKLLCWLFKS
jgi:hypothetical protein